jgi:hypothetical protein
MQLFIFHTLLIKTISYLFCVLYFVVIHKSLCVHCVCGIVMAFFCCQHGNFVQDILVCL